MHVDDVREAVRLKEQQESQDLKEVNDAVDAPDFGPSYEVLSVIGTGGMGTVYKVRDTATGTIYAIKTLQPDLVKDAVALKRFEGEADAARQLDHPHLVSIHDFGTTASSIPYMVMEYMEGNNLQETIKQEGCLDPKRSIDLFIQIAEGLEYAHRQGILHRDLKPTNVILSNTASGEMARVVDFGIATVLPTVSRETRDLTQTGEVFGSPHYMSPEQCLGFMVDQRSDIYSFGCLMYETLLGKPPFDGATPVQLIVGHINNEVPPFPRSSKSTKQAAQLESIVMRCLEKEQGLRYQSVEALLNDLKLVSEGKSIPVYTRSKRAKPSLTTRQAVGIFASIALLLYLIPTLFYSVVSNSIATTVGFVIVLIITCAGTYVFTSTGIDRLKRLLVEKGTARQWCIVFLLFSVGLIGLAFLPWIGTHLYSTYQSGTRIMVEAVCFWQRLSVGVFIGVALTAGLGSLALTSKKKVSAGGVALKLALFYVAAWTMFVTVFPKQFVYTIVNPMAHSAHLPYPQVYRDLSLLASQLDKEDFSSLGQLAVYYDDHKEYEKAVEYQSRMLTLDKSKLGTNHMRSTRALTYLKLGETEKAKADADALIAGREQKWIGYYLRGICRGQEKNLDGAMKDYEMSLKLNPSSTNPTYGYRIGTYCSLGQFDKAIEALNEMVNITDLEAQSLVMRGILQSQIGREAAAQSDFAKVVELASAKDKGKSEYYYPLNNLATFAYAYKRMGNQPMYEDYLERFQSRRWHVNDSFEEHIPNQLHLQFAKNIDFKF